MSGNAQHAAKRQKTFAARSIETQRGSVANKDGVIRVEELVESRKFEINALTRAIRQSRASGAQRAFQSLPKHLRRRAASHNPSRLPKRLRHRARKEVAIDAPKPPKRKPYKVPRFATKKEEFRWRQREKKWLETNVWHAKRMHMQELWGYRLAETPTDKSFRPAYRASTRTGIIHDMSYMAVIRIKGPLKQIKGIIDASTDPTCTSVASARYLDGSRMGFTRMYAYGKWPKEFICPIKFLWIRPPTAAATSLLLFVHPSAARQVLDDLKATILDKPDISIDDLRDEFAIFDIVGPFATEALQETLSLVPRENSPARKTWQDLKGLGSTASLGSGVVLSLDVNDPRLSYPPKAIHGKTPSGIQLTEALHAWTKPDGLVRSRLWLDGVRQEVNESQISQADINKRKEKNKVPGSRLPILESDPEIPVVLIQQNASLSSTVDPIACDSMSGWAFIAPVKWSLPFWHHLVYTGLRVAGQREKRNQHFECGVPCFPHDFGACTTAGKDVDIARAVDEKEYWERRPPSKRVNYDKLGVSWPFQAPWEKLVLQEELASTVVDSLDVQPWLIQGKKSIDAYIALASGTEAEDKFLGFINSIQMKRCKEISFSEVSLHHAVVMVRLSMIDKGAPMRLAMIHAVRDQEEYKECQRMHKNDNVKTRRARSDIHFSDKEDEDEDEDEMEIGSNGDVDVEMDDEAASAPTPRRIIGFVSTGRYALSTGHGQGIGTCSALKLLELLCDAKKWSDNPVKSPPPVFVQIRNPKSRHYRPAHLEILT